jgi:hypothetical protein
MLVLLRFHCLKENTFKCPTFSIFFYKISILIRFEIYDKSVIYLEKKSNFIIESTKELLCSTCS